MAMIPVERGLENSVSEDFFTVPFFCGHEDDLVGFLEAARCDKRGQLFIFLEFHEAADRLSARCCAASGSS